MQFFSSKRWGILILMCSFTTALFACKTSDNDSTSAGMPQGETESSLVPIVCIDGKAVVGDLTDPQLVKAKLHEELKLRAGFPDYYGKNWDALFDMLSDAKYSNMSLIISDYESPATGLGAPEAEKFKKVLSDAVQRDGTLFEYSLLSAEESLSYKCQ